MSTIYDVDQNELIKEMAKELKQEEEIKILNWTNFVKTGNHKERVPDGMPKDWVGTMPDMVLPFSTSIMMGRWQINDEIIIVASDSQPGICPALLGLIWVTSDKTTFYHYVEDLKPIEVTQDEFDSLMSNCVSPYFQADEKESGKECIP